MWNSKQIIRIGLRSLVGLAIVGAVAFPFLRAAEAGSSDIPSIVKAGLAVYASGGAEPAMSVWKKGGALERQSRATEREDDLQQIAKALGNYRAYEAIETREISKSSRMIYLAMNFDRGAAYASFLVYHTSKDWVVQSMDFSLKPEAIMPWLALSANK